MKVGVRKSINRSKFRAWLITALSICLVLCISLGMLFAGNRNAYADEVAVKVNPLINSNVGKHGEWYYGLTKNSTSSANWQKDVDGDYMDGTKQGKKWTDTKKSSWMSQIGLDGVESATYDGVTFNMTQRDHKLVQSEPYKDENKVEKVFTIDSPEDAARVWAEAVAFALGESEDSPFKGESYQDKSLDLLTGEVQKLADGSVAQGNYFAGAYQINDEDVPYSDKVPQSSGQWTYKGTYITIKLNCDWYAKPIQTNILFTPENFFDDNYTTPALYCHGDLDKGLSAKLADQLNLWTTTFNWTDSEESYKEYWNEARRGYSDGTVVTYKESAATAGVNVEGKQNADLSKNSRTNKIADTSFKDGYESKGEDGVYSYYASYDLCINSDDKTYTLDEDSYTLKDGKYTKSAEGAEGATYFPSVISENVTSPFSYGRINVPTGVYIVLDLNGHTISRDLADDDYDEIQHHGSILKERYEYPLGVIQNDAQAWVGGKEQSLKNTTMYGNPYCYYGSVINVQPKARLEIMDSTAYERASDGRIERLDAKGDPIPANDTTTTVAGYRTNHSGTIMGGCADQKYVSYVDPGIDASGWSTGTKLMAAKDAKATADVKKDGAVITSGNENTFRVGSAYATWGYANNEGKGGCIHAEARSEFILHSGTLTNCQAEFGGAIYLISNSAMIFYNGYVLGNYGSLYGGGIYLASASRAVFTVYDGVVSYNRAAGYGGGIALRDTAYVNIHDGDITYNVAGSYGGGVHIGPSSEGLLENATIRFNTAGIYGGGIYVDAETQSFEFAGALIVTDNIGSAAKAYYHRDFTYTDYAYTDEYNTPHKDAHLYNHSSSKNAIYHVSFYPSSTTPVSGEDYGGVKDKIGGARKAEVAKGDAKSEYSDLKRSDGTNANDYTYGSGRNAELHLIGGVIWKSEDDKPKASANNLFLASSGTKHAQIVIGDSLFQNGINARIGITLQSEHPTNFTTGYKETGEETVHPNRYFTSDSSGYYVDWYNSKDAQLRTGSQSSKALTWRITGKLYGKEGKDFVINATEETTFKWDLAESIGGSGDTLIPSFLWTTSQLRFDHKMFEVTKVEALDSEKPEPVKTWDIAALPIEESGDKTYSFHYLLEERGTENKATDGKLVYAGDYSFRVTNDSTDGTIYSNTSFTITINQLGVAVSAYEVKDGEITWGDPNKPAKNPFKGDTYPSTDQIAEYLEGALYYRGTPYDFVLDSRYDPATGLVKDSEGKTGTEKFTGAVMKFTYANADFFGTNVEVNFKKVNFGLEYYWRELGDSAQKELEKTNYFLHAGFYEVRGAHEVDAKGDTVTTGVDYMKNNIAFQSEMHLPIQRVSVSVWLEEKASIQNEGADGYYGYTFKNAIYTTKQILYFNNNDEAGNDPELDPNVVVQYYLFDDYIANGAKATPVGIRDNVDGTERYGVRDAGKYVVHVSLNTQMWIEGDEGKDDFTERGKPYNDYIFTSRETQRMEEKKTTDEQGHNVAYEFAYYFFIQPAVITSWEDKTDPEAKGAGHLSLEDRIYDATDDEPEISGKMRSATEENAFYPFDPFKGDTDGVYVRYLSKKDYSELDDIEVTADDIERPGNSKWAIWDKGTEYEVTDANGNQILKSKFQPTDAGEYWILVYFRGVMPVKENDGSKKGDTAADDTQTQSYIPVTNFKGVYIGTYTIKPVEVTVTGSLSYTYDGSSFERARFLPANPELGYSDWYESIFFLVQDNKTTSSELIEGQGGDISGLDDLWGGSTDDMHHYQSRFTLSNPTVSYSDESFKDHDISLGIGLYSFKTEKADQGTYHLTTVDHDNVKATDDGEGGTLTEPQSVGATWIITYASGDKQTQAFNTSKNFVIDTTSWLDVTINRKDISDLHDGVTKIGAKEYDHWTSETEEKGTMPANGNTGIVYPFAGSNLFYRPEVSLTYTPSYTNGGERKPYQTWKDGAAANVALEPELSKDISVTYSGNNAVGEATIRIEGLGNYMGSMQLKFNIRAARIVAIKTAEETPVYDMTPHAIQITYENVEDYTAYLSGILYKSADGRTPATAEDLNNLVPGPSSLAVHYAKRGTQDQQVLDPDLYGVDAPVDAGVYGVLVELGDTSFTFDLTSSEDAQKPPVTEGEQLECGVEFFKGMYGDKEANMPYYAHGTHTVLPATVSVWVDGEYVYNGTPQQATLRFKNEVHANVIPVAEDYKLSYDTVEAGSFPTDAGTYTLSIQLTNKNYAFVVTAKNIDEAKKVTGYDATFGTTADFRILRAALNVKLAAASAYFNRKANPADVQINNVQPANGAVPSEGEYTVGYTIAEGGSLSDGNKPFGAGEYTVTVTLVDKGAKNYVFEVATGDHHFEGVADSEVRDEIYYRSPVDAYTSMSDTWTVNKLQVSASQQYTNNVYDRNGHFFFGEDGKVGAWGIDFTTTQISGNLDGLGYILEYSDGTHTYVVTAKEMTEEHKATDFSVTKDGVKVEKAEDLKAVKELFENAKKYTFTLKIDDNLTFADGLNKLTLTYEITRSILSMELYEGEVTDKAASRSIDYNGAEHKLYPILKSSNSGAELLTDGGAYDYNADELTVENSYLGWNKNNKDDALKFIDVGTYSVELTLKSDNFAFDVSGTKSTTLTYNINALNLATLSSATVKNIVKLTGGYTLNESGDKYTITLESGKIIYTGYEITPVTDLWGYLHDSKDGEESTGGEMGYPLVAGASYTLSYLDNINEGNATVRITGAQNYLGIIEITFKITPKSLGTATAVGDSLELNDKTENNKDGVKSFQISESNFQSYEKNNTLVYRGTEFNVSPQLSYTPSADANARTLNEGQHYKYTYYYYKQDEEKWVDASTVDGILHAGTYRAFIEAKEGSNYTGAYIVEFTVSPSKVQVSNNLYNWHGSFFNSFAQTYNGQDLTPLLTFTSATGIPSADEYQTAYFSKGWTTSSDADSDYKKRTPKDAGAYYLSITLNKEGYTDFVWDSTEGEWFIARDTNSRHIFKLGMVRGDTTLRIYFLIHRAEISVDEIPSVTFDPLATDGQKPQIVFRNTDPNNPALPKNSADGYGYTVTFAPNDGLVSSTEAQKAPFTGNLPYHAGEYKVTITFTGDEQGSDRYNFSLTSSSMYKTFTITPLEVSVTQAHTENVYDALDHFRFDDAKLTDGNESFGAWQVVLNPATGTSDEGISYNFRYKAGETTYLVKYDAVMNAVTWYTVSGDVESKLETPPTGLFKNVKMGKDDDGKDIALPYEFTIEFSSDYTVTGSEGAKTQKTLSYTITPALLSVNKFASRTFANETLGVTIDETTFVATNSTLNSEEVYNLLKETVGLVYLKDGKEVTPFNAGTYTVQITINNPNFAFNFDGKTYSSVDTSQTFTVEPFDISTAAKDDFVVTLNSQTYTGVGVPTTIVSVTIKFTSSGELIKFDTTDNVTAYNLYHTNAGGYLFTTEGDNGHIYISGYTNNVNAGTDTANAILTGTANFKGTREVTFTIDPARVIVSASDGDGDDESLTFIYNATNHEVTFTFEHVAAYSAVATTDGLPTSADYEVLYYTAYSIASPNENRTTLLNAGSYVAVIKLTSGNFIFADIDKSQYKPNGTLNKTVNDQDWTVSFPVTVAQAKLDVYLPSFYDNALESKFKNEFYFTDNDQTAFLSIYEMKNPTEGNSVTPEPEDVSITIENTDTNYQAGTVIDTGEYCLTFAFKEGAAQKNFVLNKVYLGTSSTTSPVELTKDVAGKGFEKNNTSAKFLFTIVPAPINVRFSDLFTKNNGAEFNDQFVYSGSDWVMSLGNVTIIAAEPTKTTATPKEGEWSMEYYAHKLEGNSNATDGWCKTDTIVDIGYYTVTFRLGAKTYGENRKKFWENYELRNVYAGNTKLEIGQYRRGKDVMEDDTIKEKKDVYITVAFTLNPAEIELHLADQFVLKENEFTFTFDNKDWVERLKTVQATLVPNTSGTAPTGADGTATFTVAKGTKVEKTVYDVGSYTFTYKLRDDVTFEAFEAKDKDTPVYSVRFFENFVIKAVYAGSGTSAKIYDSENASGALCKVENGTVTVDFAITQSQIDVNFSDQFMRDNVFTSQFYYDRSDWVTRLSSATPTLTTTGDGVIPESNEYVVIFCQQIGNDWKEVWRSDTKGGGAILDAGKYAVSFRFKDEAPAEGRKQYWENYKFVNALVASQKLKEGQFHLGVKGTDANKYISIPFAIIPNVVTLQSVGTSTFSGKAQDAPITFSFAKDGGTQLGSVLPDLAAKDYTLSYKVTTNEDKLTCNELLGEGGKPRNAGFYDVTVTFGVNFVFAGSEDPEDPKDPKDPKTSTALFEITPATVSAFLSSVDGLDVENAIVYDSKPHKYTIGTSVISATAQDPKTDASTSMVYGYSYSGWAGNWTDEDKVAKYTDGYKHAGTYVLTLKLASKESEKLCNYWFGEGLYEMSFSYSITPFDLHSDGGSSVLNIENQYYNGKPLTASAQVTAQLIKAAEGVEPVKATLVSGEDYSETHTADINVGTVTVTISGLKNYMGTVTVYYEIMPAVVSVSAGEPLEELKDGDTRTTTYNGQMQSLIPEFKNLVDGSKTAVLPSFSPVGEAYSDYTGVYTANGKEVSRLPNGPINAGEYIFTLTLKEYGTNDNPNFTFRRQTGVDGDGNPTYAFENTITVKYIIEKAKLTLNDIPNATYSGSGETNRHAAKISFTASSGGATPQEGSYTVEYKVDGASGYTTKAPTEAATYTVRVTLTGDDIDNFDTTVYEKEFTIDPAELFATLPNAQAVYDGRQHAVSSEYDKGNHTISFTFTNVSGTGVLPEYNGKVNPYTVYFFTNADVAGFGEWTTAFPTDAATYNIRIVLGSSNFVFSVSADTKRPDVFEGLTYSIDAASILLTGEADATGDVRMEGKGYELYQSWCKLHSYSGVPVEIALDGKTDVALILETSSVDTSKNYESLVITYVSCVAGGKGSNAFEKAEDGHFILSGTGTYEIVVQISAPNHITRSLTFTVTISPSEIRLHVQEDARIKAVYGDDSAESVLKAFLNEIRRGTITVTGIEGINDSNAQADWLLANGFAVTVECSTYSGSHHVPVNKDGYKIAIAYNGYDSDILFKINSTRTDRMTADPIYFVKPLAVEINYADIRAEGHTYAFADLCTYIFRMLRVSNAFEGDDVKLAEPESTGKWVSKTETYTEAKAIDVGGYWIKLSELSGNDANNYVFVEAASVSENGTEVEIYRDGYSYGWFEIVPLTVEISLSSSQSVYGEQSAIFGKGTEKSFAFGEPRDEVLTQYLQANGKNDDLRAFILDLLAIYNTDGTRLDAAKVPSIGEYTVKIDPLSELAKKMFAGEDGKYYYTDEHNFILDFGGHEIRHTIVAREVTLELAGKSSYYGEKLVDLNNKAGSADRLPWSERWSVSALSQYTVLDDDIDALNEAINIETAAKATSNAGDYEITATVRPTEVALNYNIQWVKGTYEIEKRPIRVNIHEQSTVYGEANITAHTFTDEDWEVEDVDETNLGLAAGQSKAELLITLSVGTFSPNVIVKQNGDGTYEVIAQEGVISGNCGNDNYEVTYTGGGYKITQREVRLNVDPMTVTYGDAGIFLGAEINATWQYANSTPYHILGNANGLRFYIGDDKGHPEEKEERFLTAGSYEIWAEWSADDPEQAYNYKFVFDRGTLTVNNATVTQEDVWESRQPFRENLASDVKDETTGWYRVLITADMFGLHGDYGLTGEEKLEFVSANKDTELGNCTFTYRITLKNGLTVDVVLSGFKFFNADGEKAQFEFVTTEDGESYLLFHSVGEWTFDVTITAGSHNEATFEYTFVITSVHAILTLQRLIPEKTIEYKDGWSYADNNSIGIVYHAGLDEYDLTELLESYIFDTDGMIFSVTGTFVDAYKEMYLEDWIALIRSYTHIEVVGATVSKGGYLNAGTYDLQIVAKPGAPFTAAFAVSGIPTGVGVGGERRLVVKPYELEIEWLDETKLHEEEKVEQTDDAITYTYSGWDYVQIPTFTNVLEGDDVTAPEQNRNFMFYDLTNEEEVHFIRNVGSYELRLLYDGDTILLLGRDAGNYVLPEKLTMAFNVIQRQVTVTIEDNEAVHYGDRINRYFERTVEGLGHDDHENDLGIQFTICNADDEELEYKSYVSNVGKYRVLGEWNNPNYDVVFVGSWDGDDEYKGHAGTYTITPRPIDVTIESASSTYGDDDPVFTYNKPIANLAFSETFEDIGIALTRDAGQNAGRYAIKGDRTNGNYAVTFHGDWESADEFNGHAGTYTIEEKEIHITINAQSYIYGEWHDDSDMANLALGFELTEDSRLGWLDEKDSLKLTIRKESGEHVGAYDIFAAEDDDPNYIIVVDNAAEGNKLFTITQRKITVVIEDSRSVYSEALVEDSAFTWHVGEGLGLAKGDDRAVLNVVLTLNDRATAKDAGKYVISGRWTNPDYDVQFAGSWVGDDAYNGHAGTYEILRAKNVLNRSFLLEEMNEGDTPDESLVTPVSKFGTVVVTYWRDEARTDLVVGELSKFAAGTYYVTVTVAGTINYTDINEEFSFRVNESFGVVNNDLDILPYILVWSLQVPILAAALIFARKKKKRAPAGGGPDGAPEAEPPQDGEAATQPPQDGETEQRPAPEEPAEGSQAQQAPNGDETDSTPDGE